MGIRRASFLSAGRPYTPFDLAASRAQQRGIFDSNQVNAVGLPDYLRIDIRVDRVFLVHGKPLRVFFGAQKVVDRQNIAGYSLNRRNNQIEVDTQIAVSPFVGMDWRF